MVLRILLSCIVVLFGSELNSQSQIDSLNNVAKKFMISDRDSFFIVSDKIIELAKKQNNDSILSEAFLARGMVYQLAKDYQSAMDYYDSAMVYTKYENKNNLRARFGISEMLLKLNIEDDNLEEIFKSNLVQAKQFRDSILISNAYTRYANFYMNKADYVNAIQMLIYSINYKKKVQKLSKILDQAKLAKLFLLIDDIPKAEYYTFEAQKLAKQNKYSISKKIISTLRGKIESRKGNYERADSFLNIALKSYTKFRAKKDIFNTNLLLAELKIKEGKSNEAREYFNAANKYFSDKYDLTLKSFYYLIKSKIELIKGEYILASNSLDTVENYLEHKNNLLFRIDMYKTRAELEKRQNNFEKSLFFSDSYHNLQDSLFKFKFVRQILDMEAKYQTDEKQKQIELLAANNKVYKLKLKQEKLEKFIILAGAFSGFIFLLFLGITYYKVREKNKLIEKTLKQKDILLKEIHHRVKNNLQLISSLLNLQSRYIKDEKAKQVSLDGKNRVRAMSLIHQFLYQKENLINLSLDEYFKKLVKELFEAYRIHEDRIKVDFNIESFELDVDRVIPLGLIFNELITNILKYAFPGERKGKIQIDFKRKDKKLILEISDNGVGFDGETNLSDNSTFGFTLIDALLKKWNGKFEIVSDNGTKATILIPDVDYKGL